MSQPKTRRRTGWLWSRLHFLVRLFGLTGFLAVCVGLLLARRVDQFLQSWPVARDTLHAALEGRPPADFPATLGVYGLLGGAAALLLLLLVEAALVLRFVAGRRSLMGANALVQVALAAALVVGVNVVWFQNPLRWDWTRGREFTLPASVRADLRQLRGDTTVVVYQRYQSVGAHSDKRDRYDLAAEHKVIELVKDVADQFRQVGPNFRVVVLDVNDDGYEKKLADLTADAPELKAAIAAAPENSIFFHSAGKVQRLSFDEFYLLDKTASKEGRGNLVLLAQGKGASGRGVEALADKILNLDERRPRVGVLVVHELLTTESDVDFLTLKGLRKALTARGFEVRDVVLRKNLLESPNPEPVAYTLEENKVGTLEKRLRSLDAQTAGLNRVIERTEALIEEWTVKPGEDEEKKLAALSAKYGRALGVRRITAERRAGELEFVKRQLEQIREELAELTRERAKTAAERDRLDREAIVEGRRLSDLHAKLTRVLSDCDVLLIPRLTRHHPGDPIPYRVFRLDDVQVRAIKEFMRQGKPVLACLGPRNEPRDNPRVPPDAADGSDNFEQLLGELGVRLPPQTVLFRADSRAIAEYNPLDTFASEGDEIPALDFDVDPRALLRRGAAAGAADPNPLRESLRVTARSSGAGLDLRLRFARPVYFDATKPWQLAARAATGVGLAATAPGPVAVMASEQWSEARAGGAASGAPRRPDAVFLTTAVGWNEGNPFADEGLGPRYEPPKPDDPATGTYEEKRLGPFPVGVAIDAPVPASWSKDSDRHVRVAVIGQGNVFTGKELAAPQEHLLLQTTNWLLGREGALPRADHPWRYPRVELTPDQQEFWRWGVQAGLPVAFAFLGIVVLLARRIR